MRSHEIRMASTNFGEMAEDIKPIVRKERATAARSDAVFEYCWCAPGDPRRVPKTMLIPEAGRTPRPNLPKALAGMYGLLQLGMEPWDWPRRAGE